MKIQKIKVKRTPPFFRWVILLLLFLGCLASSGCQITEAVKGVADMTGRIDSIYGRAKKW